MSKNRLNTIICIIMVAVLSLGATIAAIVVSRSEFNKRDEMHGCVMTSLLQNLRSDLNQICKRPNLLEVYYNREKVQCDDMMTKEATSHEPTLVTFHNLDKEKSYWLLMVDPDAPKSSVESLTFFVHWIVSGITVDNVALEKVGENILLDSNFVLGNAQAAGCPIVYCSDGFVELTGFPRSQVMGRSCACKFLFGEETHAPEKDKIEEALENKQELKTELVFYRKDSQKFKCLLDIVPIKNEKSQVVLILVSHKDVGDKEQKNDDSDEKSSSENDSDEEMAEAYRRCQARQGRSSGALPGTAGYASQRRRSRAVLYHLSGQFEKHNRANRAKSKLQQLNKLSSISGGSISGKMPEYKVQEVKKSRFILVHYGILKIAWDWLILLCTFYTAILVPFNAAFTRPENKNKRDSIYADVVVEILFMFDILFNFRTSFVNKSGQVVYQARLIAINYIRGWFPLDLLAAIPFDFLLIFKINADAPVHLLKVARLLRLARLLQKIDRFSQYSALVLALLMSMFFLLAHWFACVWYAIGHVEFEDHVTAGWLYELSERLNLQPAVVLYNQSDNITVMTQPTKVPKPDIFMSYLSALYFTCSSLTSVGFGNVSANTYSEKIFSICAMIIGALMHAVVFGNVTALIGRMYQRRANFHSKTKDLKDFFRAYDIPKPLKQRMQEYFQTMWSMNNGIETSEILKDFPEEMKGELGLHLHKEVLNLPIFEEATQGCLKSIALHTRRAFCAPGEFLVHKGDAANYLYLLVSGSMEVLKLDMVVAILGKGDLFGAHIDFDDPISVCNYDVRSLTYSELQCISIKGLVDVLILYPDFAEKFAKDIHNELTYNLRQEGEDSDEEVSSSPKGRVCTLPSISEDDEGSDSDLSKSADKSQDEDEENDVTCPTPLSQSSSPLLPKPIKPKIPNGDIPLETINSPSTGRTWGVRRGSTANNAINRSSFKDARKLRLGNHTDPAVEKLLPHVQNLQNEIEGTKSAVSKLERKVSKIGQDICAIDRNMREILKNIQNISKISPVHLEPIVPGTPSTPFTTRTNFPFEHRDGMSDNIGISDKVTLVQKLGKSNLGSVVHDRLKGVNSVKSQSELFGSENLLNPHEVLSRRHSDGPEIQKCDKNSGNLLSSKSDYSIPKTIRSIDPDGSRKNPVSPHDTGERYAEPLADKYRDNYDSNSSLAGMLEEIHSYSCSAKECTVKKSYTSDGFADRPRDKQIQKSVTCGQLELSSNLLYGQTGTLDDRTTGTAAHTSAETGLFSFVLNDTIPSTKQTEKVKRTPVKSKSWYDMVKTSETPHISQKAKSHDVFVTEFGACTPNEVRTFQMKQHTIDESDAVKSIPEVSNEPRGSPNTYCTDKDVVINVESPILTTLDFKRDSGNSSLLENIADDEPFDFPAPKECEFHIDKSILPLNARRPSLNDHLSNKCSGVQGDCSEIKGISPDSVTDISESLQTDSLRTENETAIDDCPNGFLAVDDSAVSSVVDSVNTCYSTDL